MKEKRIPTKSQSNSLILSDLKVRAKDARDWKNVKKSIPFGSPSTKPLDIAKDAHNIFFPMNYNNIGLLTTCSEEKLYGTRKIEREVLSMIANQFKISNYHGYLTSGGTESNFMGLWLAREKFSNSKDILLVKSPLTHYSIQKIARILGIKNVVETELNDNYSIDILSLKKKILESKASKVVVVLTLGYTTTGTLDDTHKVIKTLRRLKIKNSKFQFIIHVDACIGGFPLAFLNQQDKISFKYPEIKSIAIDGHKAGLMPYPTAFFYCKKNMMNTIIQPIEYTGQIDATISGSRSGLSTVYAYSTLLKLGKEGYKDIFKQSIKNKKYFIKQLRKTCPIDIISNELMPAVCVVFKDFKQLPKEIEKQFGLCTFNLPETKSNKEKVAYKFYFMPTTTKEVIDSFLIKLKQFVEKIE